MLIKVIYQTNEIDVVESSQLQGDVSLNQIPPRRSIDDSPS